MPADEFGSNDQFTIDGPTLRQLLPTVFQRCSFSPPQIEDATRTATATKAFQEQGYFPGSVQLQAIVRWNPVDGGLTAVSWGVFDISHGQRNGRPRLTQELGAMLRTVISLWVGDAAAREQSALPNNPITAPGGAPEQLYTGTLRDYSACAMLGEVADLVTGVLPIGSYTFGFGDKPEMVGAPLYLGQYRNEAPMEHNGVLLCAPQNSGKTSLIVRWAEAACRSTYATFLVDVKGNLRRKLEQRLQGEVYCFSTDPTDEHSDRINFLDGPMGLDAWATDRIRQLATALLPSRGYVEKGGVDEYHYQNRVIWMTAFIHLLKLAECYFPEWFLDEEDNERSVDLADLYELIVDEELFYDWIQKLKIGEMIVANRGDTVPVCGVDHWVLELAVMLDRKACPVGQRAERDTFRTFTTALLTALEPFSKHGTLHRRVRSFGLGRQFDLEAVLGGVDRPVTVILAARQQDLNNADTVLSLTIKRLQWFLFDRMTQEDAGKRPVLLLLDETRRIRDFDAPEYISFAREAKACCVVAYQSLEQIAPAAKCVELLENVGTQIYLGSMVGNTARRFMDILPQRSRLAVTRQIVRTANTETLTLNIASEKVDTLTTAELYNLPGGSWPALVYINDQPRRSAFFTNMEEPRLERAPAAHASFWRPTATVSPASSPMPAPPALPAQGREFVIGPPGRKDP